MRAEARSQGRSHETAGRRVERREMAVSVDVVVGAGLVLLIALYLVRQARRNAPRCPYLRGARHFARGLRDQCSASTDPVTDPRMTTAFDPSICGSSHYQSCPTYRAANSGRAAT